MIDLLTSRKFWALVIGVAVLLLAQVFPEFQLDEEAAIGLVIVVASYIVGVAVDPGPGGWRGVIQSRKFWGAAVGLVFLFLRGFGIGLPAELSPDLFIWLLVLIGGWIGGVAFEQFALRGRRVGDRYKEAEKKPSTDKPPREPSRYED